MAVKIGNAYTESIETYKGVRQGDPLSPTLFNLYINDLPEQISCSECKPIQLGNQRVACLQYADDTVMLSESKEGLQESLNRLGKYCEKWGMKVNTDKTKIMICTPGNEKDESKFYFEDNLVERVDRYKYLGIIFNSKGNFTEAKQMLYEKARKASFKLGKLVNNENLSPKILIDLFDKMLKPIAMYGAEIWLSPLKIQKNCINHLETAPAEKLHVSYLRYVLGTHKKSTKAAIMGETGRVPININALKTLIDFHNRIVWEETNPLVEEALQESKTMAIKKTGWYYEVEELIKFCQEQERTIPNSVNIRNYLTEKYIEKWQERTSNGGKLRTMRLFKTNFRSEPYLQIVKNGQERKQLTRLRLSAHELEIERGRYRKLEIEDRKCKTCNIVEDEMHFLMKCPRYEKDRSELMSYVEERVPNFIDLDDENKFIYLMSSEGEIIKKVAKMVTNMMKTHKNHVQQVG